MSDMTVIKVTVPSAITTVKITTAMVGAAQTAADRIQTGLDAQATAADRTQTGLDRQQTSADAQATAADRVQTDLDAQATAADRVQTGIDAQAASDSASAAAQSAANAAATDVGTLVQGIGDTQVIFKDLGAFTGDPQFTFDKTSGSLGVSKLQAPSGGDMVFGGRNFTLNFTGQGLIYAANAARWMFSGTNGDLVPYTDYTVSLGSNAARLKNIATAQLALKAAGASVWAYLTAGEEVSNAIDIRNGTNASYLRVYGTYTDKLNYERLALKYVGTGVVPGLTLTTEAGGTGTARDLVLSSASGVTHVPGYLHVGRGSSHGLLYLRTLVNDAAAGDGAITFQSADGVNGGTLKFYTAGSTGTVMGRSVSRGVALTATGNIGVYSASGDINLGGATQANPSWQVKGTSGNLLPGADNAYDIGSSVARVRSVYAGYKVSAGTIDITGAGDAAVTIGLSSGETRYYNALYIYSAYYTTGPTHMLSQSSVSGAFHGYGGTGLVFGAKGSGSDFTRHARVGDRAFEVYNTFTDAANYERAILSWKSNQLIIGTEVSGTGVARPVYLSSTADIYFAAAGSFQWQIDTSGNLRTSNDGLYDIGLAGSKRPRNVNVSSGVYAASNVTVGGNNASSGLCLVWDATDGGSIQTYNSKPLTLNPAGNEVVIRTGGIRFGTGVAALYGAVSGVIEQRNGAAAQTFRVYNTFTDAANYERGVFQWSGNQLQIGVEAAGTGIARAVYMVANAVNWRTPANTIPGAALDLANRRFDIYNANDGTNYERASLKWAGSVAYLTTEAGGTGVQRGLRIDAASLAFYTGGAAKWQLTSDGTFSPAADNTYDIGASGVNRPRNVWVAGKLAAGSLLAKPDTGNGLLTLQAAAGATYNILKMLGDGGATVQLNLTTQNGIAWYGADVHKFRAASGGLPSVQIDGTYGIRNALYYGFTPPGDAGVAPDTYIVREAAGTVALRNGAAAQELRVYNTFTDAANYSRGYVKWAANAFQIGVDNAGTGGGTNMYLNSAGHLYLGSGGAAGRWNVQSAGGHLFAGVDNTSDIGAVGNYRPKNIYAAGNIFAAGYVQAGSASFVGSGDGAVTIKNGGSTYNFLRFLQGDGTVHLIIQTLSGGAFYNSAKHSFRDAAGAAVSVEVNPTGIQTKAKAFADLPAATAAMNGTRAYITDSTLAFTGANIGAAVAGGGTEHCPVVVVNGAWVVG